MDAFEKMNEKFSPQEVAKEWRVDETESPSVLGASFEDNIKDIASCSQRLRIAAVEGSQALQAAVNELETSLRRVISRRDRLDSLLALQERPARLMLEVLQLFLDSIPHDHPRRLGITHVLVKLARRSGQLPRSLFVERITLLSHPYLSGGFGDVYHGDWEERVVALKKPRIIGADYAASHQRLCREALIWRQICHPNILPFLGLNTSAFRDCPVPTLVSPWMQHGTLMDYTGHMTYNPECDIVRLLDGIAQGTAYLHSLNITHGDLKHLNILIDDKYCPRLADFGLVRLGDSVTVGAATETSNALDVTWTSPQRLDGAVRAPSDDVYSFACIGYYLFSGLVMFEGSSTVNVMFRVVKGERPERPSIISGCVLEPTDSMWDLITSCWHDNCDMRPSMAEVCRYFAGLRTSPSTVSLAEPATKSPSVETRWAQMASTMSHLWGTLRRSITEDSDRGEIVYEYHTVYRGGHAAQVRVPVRKKVDLE